jgi:hypothetical protein
MSETIMDGRGRKVFQMWRQTSEGPVVGKDLRQALHLSDTQVQSMNKVFQKVLEAQLIQKPIIENGKVIVNVTAFPELETRVWAQLDEILDDRQRSICREKLYLKEMMPFAKEGGCITIWRHSDLTYYWEKKYGNTTTSGHGLKLPEELQTLWEKAGMYIAKPIPKWDGTQDKWVLRPDGPALSDGFAQISLELEPSQIQKFNEVLQATYKEYQVFLEQHTQQNTDENGHFITAITSFPEAITKLEEKMWSQLDPILSEEQQRIARFNLPLHPKRARSTRSLHDRGIFGWGDHNFLIEIWRVGQWYHWIVRDGSIARSSFPMQKAPQLPEEFRRFWKQPATDK